MQPQPARLEPIFSPRIWGALSLAPLFPTKSNLAEPLGEAWLTGVDCPFVSGPFEGKPLGAAWREMPAEWRGVHFASPVDFPILVKFIFPNDKLSIQVHPGDAYAALHETSSGGRGKTEMWHAVSAGPRAQVLIGLKPGVSRDQFLLSIASQNLEDFFETHPVVPGDTFYVPAGTPHTIGPGMVLCEVQEYSDLTYRVYDYGRLDAHGQPRELHVERALEVIDFDKPSGGKIPALRFRSEDAKKALLAACRYFAAERWEFSVNCKARTDPGRFELLILLSGHGALDWSGGSATYRAGDCWFFPASLGAFSLRPRQPTALLRAFVPDLSMLRAELQSEGIPPASIARVLFE